MASLVSLTIDGAVESDKQGEDRAIQYTFKTFFLIWKVVQQRMRDGVGESERVRRKILHLLVYSIRWPQQPGLDQGEARSQELYLGLPWGWQWLKHLDDHLLPFQAH